MCHLSGGTKLEQRLASRQFCTKNLVWIKCMLLFGSCKPENRGVFAGEQLPPAAQPQLRVFRSCSREREGRYSSSCPIYRRGHCRGPPPEAKTRTFRSPRPARSTFGAVCDGPHAQPVTTRLTQNGNGSAVAGVPLFRVSVSICSINTGRFR